MAENETAPPAAQDEAHARVEEVVAEPAPAPPVRRAVEAWAEEKGHLPQFREGEPQRVRLGGKIVEIPTIEHNAEHWKFVAAKHLHSWPIGHELTEAEFDAAIEAGANVRLG